MPAKTCVLITGASKGLGFALVQEFLKSSTMVVVACSRQYPQSLNTLQKRYPNRILFFKTDLTQQQSILKLFKAVTAAKLVPEIVLNNAGTLLQKPFVSSSSKAIKHVYDVNVFAPMQIIQQCLKCLPKQHPLHIINIASMGGVQGSVKFPGLSIYASSKAALLGLTECLAEEFKTLNIRSNAIALGATQTEMFAKAFPKYTAPVSPEQVAQWICMFALGPAVINGKIIPLAVSTP